MKNVAGGIRRSQVIYAGIGGIVDLPGLSVMVRGLGSWRKDACPEVEEPRLLAAVQGFLGPQVQQLRESPSAPDSARERFPTAEAGVPITPFPQWVRCPLCDALAPLQSGLFDLRREPYQPDRLRYVHSGCPKRRTRRESAMPGAVPARFVLACTAGHLEDFPWLDYVHGGERCDQPTLRLFELGVSGEAVDVMVKCERCGRSRSMGDAFSKAGREFPCGGFHPHLGSRSECSVGTAQTILVGATNSYFPITFSVVSLPRGAGDLAELVSTHWDVLRDVESPAVLSFLRKQGQLSEFVEQSDETLMEAIETYRTAKGSQAAPAREIKRAEWDVLTGWTSLNSSMLKTRRIEPPPGFEDWIESVLLVERFTEVRALVGFTRIESTGDVLEIDSLPRDRLGPLARTAPSWVPAVRFRGEGVFLQFRESRLAGWELSATVRARQSSLRQAYQNWCTERPWLTAPPPFLGARIHLLHTISHSVLREFGIQCGYGSASLRERLYCAPAEHPQGPMAGIFIGTASPDSEGTLGGLVSLGEPARLRHLLLGALERMAICSSDPICAHYQPESQSNLRGAACHACSLAPESSCELSNRFLDRSLVVPTLTGVHAEFFSGLL